MEWSGCRRMGRPGKKKRIVLRQQLFLLVCLSSSALPKIGLRTRGSDEFRTRDVGAESWGKNMGFHRSILRFGRSVSRASPVILRRIRNLWRGIISGEPKPQTLNLRPEPSRNLQDTNPCSMCHQIIRDDGTDSPPAWACFQCRVSLYLYLHLYLSITCVYIYIYVSTRSKCHSHERHYSLNPKL